MAAPADVTIKNLNGEWTMEKNISDPSDPILAFQGVSWVTRKAISYATVTLIVKEYADSEDAKLMHIDIDQVLTGGLKGTSEKRHTDWAEREHKDHIFGTLKGRSRLIRGSKGDDGKVRPAVDINTKIDDPKVKQFLRGEILIDGSPCEGFLVDNEGEEYGEGEGLFLQSFVVNQDDGAGWTAEQIWGFETINGQRYHTRRVVVAKDGDYKMARLAYTYVKRLDA
ncbi:uncharacterized protein NFIA_103460 [Aspergillus fischeri NRRL 181]|uniref:LCCL domain protein n=1 Tax=Neosartorya fischeri (strain ATCC 1020 / DSM 3700 / CBS 544.65 / FGSC A1164 / JCM 1740 / NRRL 181 / WB 181) TaxID=331117 RepID=A1CW56_NEOFI|nr:conserved hypothetical protein [Aspergillus fischeri NRRL 181]EAW24858.1 conserved hypothetical protein [Aspergillus fischeri NRRL 181]KAG2027362.1 hypothetical protein GB937_001104 [Aspergillus fischeri]